MKNTFKAGMHLLETLTAGMYNEPLAIFREYIQNSADSIDKARINAMSKKMNISIDLQPLNRRIVITDNGFGIDVENAKKIFNSVGISEKKSFKYRGFRGIGRLGGIAFCDKAIFKTKSNTEDYESIQIWDNKGIQLILNDYKNENISLEEVFNKATSYELKKIGNKNKSYFKVILEGVHSFRDNLFDLPRVKHYLEQNVPIPFSPSFQHGTIIHNYLKKHVHNYNSYNIYLNDQKLYKRYENSVRVVKGGYDKIQDVKLLEYDVDEDVKVYGWYAIREENIGSITKSEGVSGLRTKLGNILLGDSHLLDSCFRESRFNSYIIGELHITGDGLVPNGRRDNFVDSSAKVKYYNLVERKIGIPLSRDIRQKSRLKSEKLRQQPIFNSKTLGQSDDLRISEFPHNNGQISTMVDKIMDEIKINSTNEERLKVEIHKIITTSLNYQ